MPGDEIKRLRCETLENHKSRVSRRFEFGVVSGPYGIAGAGVGVRWQIALPGSGPEVTTLEVVAQELVPILLKRSAIYTLGRLHTWSSEINATSQFLLVSRFLFGMIVSLFDFEFDRHRFIRGPTLLEIMDVESVFAGRVSCRVDFVFETEFFAGGKNSFCEDSVPTCRVLVSLATDPFRNRGYRAVAPLPFDVALHSTGNMSWLRIRRLDGDGQIIAGHIRDIVGNRDFVTDRKAFRIRVGIGDFQRTVDCLHFGIDG